MLKAAMILILSEKKEIKKEMEMVTGTENRVTRGQHCDIMRVAVRPFSYFKTLAHPTISFTALYILSHYVKGGII